MRSWVFLGWLAILAPLAIVVELPAEDVKGQVVWGGGDVPESKQINVTKDQDHCLSRGPLPSEDWVINKNNKGIRWAYVWLTARDPKEKLAISPALKDPTKKPVVIDQPCCKFEPHAIAMQAGQILIVKNSAPVGHNVNWTGGLKNPGNNVIVPPGTEIKINDLKADRFPVKLACNIHPWMSGWIRVFDNPYFAVTDADGKFVIKGVPVGNVRLIVWHESVGYLGGASGKSGMPIMVEAGKATDVGKLSLAPSP